jgi:hypothetical protein
LVWIATAVLVMLASGLPSSPASGQGSDTFRIVVLPDTQNYVTSGARSEIALSQFGWVIEDAAASDIAFVTHVGDVVQNPNSLLEWDRIEPGFDGLDDNDTRMASRRATMICCPTVARSNTCWRHILTTSPS